jgi:uncharacterized protein (TIGR02145 family)
LICFYTKIPIMKKALSLTLFIFTVSLFFGCKKEEPAKIPEVATALVSNVTATTAKSGGTISSDGGASITVRGVCWGSTVNPTLSDSKTTDSEGSGQFVSSIINLTAGTTYHLRAYATNSAGTAYGEDLTFTTLGQTPAATTQAVTNISASGATLNGTVNANDLSTTVTFEYGTTTSYGQTAEATPGEVTGNTSTTVSTVLSGLTPGVTYHFKIKAVNSLGTVFGDDIVFTTAGLAPIATTQAATNTSSGGSTLNGTVNANGLSTTVTFEYGTTTSYGQTAVATPGQVTGNTSTAVSSVLSGLTPGVTYHFKIKAVNSLGTVFGDDMVFTTIGMTPTATTQAATNTSSGGSTLNGTVNANGLSTTVSFEYGTTTSYGQTAAAAQSPVTGNVITNVNAAITGLTQGTTYHFRIKAVNSVGTSYGNDLTFTTTNQATYVTDIDGNLYTTVTIGTQVWLKENLKTTKYNDGTAIPNVTDNAAWSTLTTGAYCDYSNTPVFSTLYGRLYNWYAIGSTNSKNACPTGYHAASDADWTTLSTYLGELTVVAGKLKEQGTNDWTSPNVATNETGFTALPGGYRSQGGTFGLMGSNGFWWTATEGGTTFSFFRNMLNSSSNLIRGDNDKHAGFSVRCVK